MENLWLVAANPPVPWWVLPRAPGMEKSAKVIQILCIEGGKMST